MYRVLPRSADVAAARQRNRELSFGGGDDRSGAEGGDEIIVVVRHRVFALYRSLKRCCPSVPSDDQTLGAEFRRGGPYHRDRPKLIMLLLSCEISEF